MKTINQWYSKRRTGKPGTSEIYSDIARECALILKQVFHLPLRGTEGLLSSLIDLMKLPLVVPNYSLICRRQKSLILQLPRSCTGSPLHVVVDATGLKVDGEGEWKTRLYGPSKRRTWRKLHLAIDEASHAIVAAALTTNDFKDGEPLADLIDTIPDSMEQVSADGAYDSWKNDNLLAQKEIRSTIPPRKDAKIKRHGNSKAPPLPRDEIVRAIKRIGRKAWKQSSDYHRRSLAETAMFRYKSIFTPQLKAHLFENQATEALIRSVALNKMTQLGMPNTVAV